MVDNIGLNFYIYIGDQYDKLDTIYKQYKEKGYSEIKTDYKLNSDRLLFYYPCCKMYPTDQRKMIESFINNIKDGNKNIVIFTNSTDIVNTITYYKYKEIINLVEIHVVLKKNKFESIYHIDSNGNWINIKTKQVNSFKDIGFFDATLDIIFEMNGY